MEKKIKVRIIWHGESREEMQLLYQLLEDILNDPEMDLIDQEAVAESLMEQMKIKN